MKMSKKSKAVIYILLGLVALYFLAPFIYMLFSAFKTEGEAIAYAPKLFPSEWHFENFANAWKSQPFGTYLLNSVLVTALTTIGQVLSCSLVAYGFARFNFKGKNVLFMILLSTMMIPWDVTMIPQYMEFKLFGWINTLKPLIVPAWFGSAYYVFLMRQFLMGIPKDFEEAARIDGANQFQIYWKIFMPIMKPSLILAAIGGGVTGTFLFTTLGGGLKAAASPGSILAILLVSAKDAYFGNIVGVLGAAVVSFIIAAIILKNDKSTGDELEAKQAQMQAMKAQSKGQSMPEAEDAHESVKSYANVKKIIFACDAGMGSSAMGASLLRDKFKKAGIKVSVTNTAVRNLKDEDGLLVITQEELADRALQKTPHAMHVAVGNFLSSPKYDTIVASFKALTQVEDKPKAEKPVKKVGSLEGIDFSKVKEVDFIRHDQHLGTATMATSLFNDASKKAGKTTPVKAVRINELTDDPSHLVIVTPAANKNLAVRYSDIQILVVDDLLKDKKLGEAIQKLN